MANTRPIRAYGRAILIREDTKYLAIEPSCECPGEYDLYQYLNRPVKVTHDQSWYGIMCWLLPTPSRFKMGNLKWENSLREVLINNTVRKV